MVKYEMDIVGTEDIVYTKTASHIVSVVAITLLYADVYNGE